MEHTPDLFVCRPAAAMSTEVPESLDRCGCVLSFAPFTAEVVELAELPLFGVGRAMEA